jgi:hypothetical protein
MNTGRLATDSSDPHHINAAIAATGVWSQKHEVFCLTIEPALCNKF